MIGAGYVGLVSGACFADLGNSVWCVDKNKEKIDLLNTNQIPFFEPGLQELVSKNFSSARLNFTTNFRVNAYVGSGWGEPGGKNYQQTTTGSLPSSVEKIDADFDLINSDLDNFEISHSGSFDQWRVALEDTSINAFWSIYNSSSTSTMILPSIPTDVIDEYSSLSNPSFDLYHISLTDWMCAETYKEWVELFHSTNSYYLDFCNGFHNLNFWPAE